MQKRLFVALDIPEKIKQRIERLCSGLPGARWVASDQLHMTLCFIGEVDGSTFYDVQEALAEITFDPFFMRLDGVGFFPPRGKPRVIWVGIEKNKPLGILQKRIFNQLTRLDLHMEKRKFYPHITLARLKNTPVNKVGRYLEHNSLFMSESFQVENFMLYSSILSPKGAQHIIEQQYLLKNN